MNVSNNNGIIHGCTSCQICASVCPTNAITISLSTEGFYRPFVNSNKCIDCSLCTKYCYKYDNAILEISQDSDLSKKQLYSAWAKDDSILRKTTSGGIADILSRFLLSIGYKVVGVVYNEETNRAEHRIATTEEDIKDFRGSKYIQSYTLDSFKQILIHSKQEKYAIFGTPCQIYALNRFCEYHKCRHNFFFIDLYCHGCPSILVWDKYQQYIKKKYNSASFKDVEFRSKVKGWGSFIVSAELDNKLKFISNPKEDGFYELFFSDQVLNDSCMDCKLRSSLEYTDIRLGDFWGKKYLNNHRGVSAVSISTERAQEIFSKVQPLIISQKCSYSDFLPYQSWGRKYTFNTIIRQKILKSLYNSHENIEDAIRILRKYQNFKQKIKRIVKSILYYCPISFTSFIKKII